MNKQVNVKAKGKKVIPNTLTIAVGDISRNQALSASLNQMPERHALGYPPFTEIEGWAKDSIVFYDRRLWQFTEAHTAGPWTGNDVKPYSVKEHIEEHTPDLSEYAKKEGEYPLMSVGSAKALESEEVITGTFFARTSGDDGEIANGAEEVANGLVKMMGVGGGSVKVNQVVKVGASNTKVIYGVTFTFTTVNGVLKVTANGTPTERFTGNAIFDDGVLSLEGVVANHVYFVKAFGTCQGATLKYYGTSVNITDGYIFTKGSATTPVLISFMLVQQELGAVNIDLYLQAIDLTALGIDNLTTVEAVEAWLAENWGEAEYYAYNAGEVVNVNMTGVESFNRNLLDANGDAAVLGNYDTSETYDSYYGICGTHGTITFTDKLGNTEAVTPDEEGKFFVEKDGIIHVADKGADCAVFLWWDGSKTDYVEHKVNVGRVDVPHIYGKKNGQGELVQVWPTGMPKVGTAQDWLTIEDGEVVAKRPVGEVDLGNLAWEAHPSMSKVYQSSDISTTVKKPSSSSIEADIVCAKYTTRASGQIVNGCVSVGTTGLIYIQDNSYNTASAFKTAVEGIKFYFELATPETYTDLVYMGSEYFADGTPVTLPNYEADNWGIERILPLNGSTILTAKPTVSAQYAIDAIETINTLNDTIEKTEKEKLSISGLPSATVGRAENLTGEKLPATTGYTIKPTGYDPSQPELEFADGLVKMTEVKGRVCAWNQLARYKTDSGTSKGITFTFNGYGATLSGTFDSGGTANVEVGSLPVIAGHKYILLIASSGDSELEIDHQLWGNGYKQTPISAIYTCVSSINARFFVHYKNGVQGKSVNAWIKYAVIDITLLNPTLAAKANLTVAEVEAYIASIRTPKATYRGNSGTLLGARLMGWNLRKTANLLNPTTKQAKLVPYNYTGHNNEYTVNGWDELTGAALQFTPYATGVAEAVTLDANNRFTISSIGVLEVVEAEAGTAITGDMTKVAVVMTYDTTMDGEVVAYEEDNVEVDSANIYYDNNGVKTQVFENGIMRSTGDSAGSVRDKVYFDEIAKKWKAILPVGDVELGGQDDSFYYKPSSGGGRWLFVVTDYRSGNARTPAICSKYTDQGGSYNVSSSSALTTDYAFAFNTNGREFYIKDPNYTDYTVSQIKAALVGVHLFYELATPITHDTLYYKVGNEYLPMEQVFPNGIQGLCCNWATETLVEQEEDANGQPQSITPVTTEVFQSDYKELLKTIGDTYISKEQAKDSFDNLLSALNTNSGTALGGTYATDGFDTDGTVQFTFTPDAKPEQ